ncbi:TPA: hypothetical protein R8I36_000607 [Campylobacter jejuni]|nr:hypothetical protein [Campylobacter jejuni]
MQKQGFYYPFIYSNLESYKFPKIFNIVNEDVYYNGAVAKSKIEQIEALEKLKKEIFSAKLKNVILSSECFQEFSFGMQDIEKLKKVLLEIGFKQINIIVYLRDPIDLVISFYNTELLLNRKVRYNLFQEENNCLSYGLHIANHKKTLQDWGNVFGKENLIVRLFNENDFYQGDLLKDFVYSIGLKWDDDFVVPEKRNETINLLGIELTKYLNLYLDGNLIYEIQKYFTFKEFDLIFRPKKKIVQIYSEYFEDLNEWVRKEFFPNKQNLFSKKDLTNYKENYELKEIKKEYWDKIAEFIANIIKNKNQIIIDKINNIKNKDSIITNQSKQTQIHLSKISRIELELSFQSKYGTAQQRIQNRLCYKLGQTMIINSKNIVDILFMPIYLLSTFLNYKQDQKIYHQKIKKDPTLKLPPLENYPDYQEALKMKNYFSYRLGEALMKASKTWYKGSLFKFPFLIKGIKKRNFHG